ncbi:MAG: glycosyltransferase family 4 protein [Elusimicrobia bacterium]|nr:glycosyltransferase family 4 protein [Elusimicrobiota bacterium]
MENRLTVFHLDDGRELRGGQRQLLYLVKELNALGHSNTVVCREGSPLHKAAQRKNFATLTLPYFFEWDPVSAVLLRRALKGLPASGGLPPLLHSHTSHAAAVSWLASAGLDCVRVAHRRVDFMPGSFTARLKYSKAHIVIAISEAVREMLLKAEVPDEKIAVVNSTIDLDDTPWRPGEFPAYRAAARKELAAELGLAQEAFWAGSLIALVPHKDPENMVRAAALVLKEEPRVVYLIAGEGPLAQKTEHLARMLKIQDRFRLIGYRRDPYKVLAALDMFVLSSVEEGMGSVLVEAMNASLPIVATTAGGIGEVIEDGANGLTVPPSDHAALARAQRRVINEPELRARLAQEAHRRREDFSSPRMAALTLKCYETAIENFKRNRHPLE